ncbi:MAG: PilZ domain-containing protein [Thermoguttaceae bacterium]
MFLKQVPVSKLRIGAVLGCPLFDNDGRKLLRGGIPITDMLLEGLRKRGVGTVSVADSDLPQLSEDAGEDAPRNNAPDAPKGMIRCGLCDRLLPLRPGKPGEPVTSWVCKGCGASYPAVLDEGCSLETCQSVRPAYFNFDRNNLTPPSNTVVETVCSLMGAPKTPYAGTERRQPRRPLTIVVPTLPLDERLRPLDEPLMMVTRNISCGGIALVHTQPIIAKYLAVELPAPDTQRYQMVVEVLHVRPVDSLYEYGGRFVTRTIDC